MHIGAGRFKGRRLPTARGARPVGARLKKSLFGILAPQLAGSRVLDLFAGVGGLGLEALSRGAVHVTFVDADREALSRLDTWLRAAGAEGEADLRRLTLGRDPVPDGPFDLVFLDPPFALWSGPTARALLQEARARLAPGGRLVVKRARERPGTSAGASLTPAGGLLRVTHAGDVEAALFGPL